MTSADATAAQPLSLSERIIVALDVETPTEARQILSELRGRVGAFKIGMQLFTAAGPEFVKEVTASGVNVFLDLKFHDIPNTVAKAGIEATRLGVWMFNVHAAGGSEMMNRTTGEVNEFCVRNGVAKPLIIGVTVLTSSNAATLRETGCETAVEEQVVRLAQLAHAGGLNGVVASPHEVVAIKKNIADKNFITVTPGIRPSGATSDDQKRVTTIREAIANGSSYVVIGRPVTQAPDRVAAVAALIAEAEG